MERKIDDERIPYGLAVHDEEEERAVSEVIRNHQTIMGDNVKQFEREKKEMEKATKSIIADAEVNGYKTEKVDVQQAGASYRAYVLLAYNHYDAQKVIENRILTMNLKKNNKNDAWDELDNVVEDIKISEEEE